MKIKTYKTLGGKDLILEYIDKLNLKERYIGYAIIELLTEHGIDGLLGLETRQLQGKLWEIKFYKHNRVFYIIVEKEIVYLLHACKKQKGKAEKFEIETALKRMNEIIG